jgi:hypothetical protein
MVDPYARHDIPRSPEQEAIANLDKMAETILDKSGAAPSTEPIPSKYGKTLTPLEIPRHDLAENETLERIAWGRDKLTSLARIRRDDGTVLYQRNQLWFQLDDSGSNITVWAAGNDEVSTSRFSEDTGYEPAEWLDVDDMERLRESLKRTFNITDEDEDRARSAGPESTPAARRGRLSRILGGSILR